MEFQRSQLWTLFGPCILYTNRQRTNTGVREHTASNPSRFPVKQRRGQPAMEVATNPPSGLLGEYPDTEVCVCVYEP